MSLWKRGRQYLDRLHRRRPSIPEAARHDESANGDAPRTRARRRSWTRPAGSRRTRAEAALGCDRRLPGCQADAVLPAHDRARGGTAQPRQEALRRRAALGDHRDGDRGVPAHAARGRHREPHDQHGRRRAVARAQVLRPVAGARRPRPQPPGAPASGRPRVDSQRSGSGSSTPPRRIRSGSTCTAPRSSPPTRRCGRSR